MLFPELALPYPEKGGTVKAVFKHSQLRHPPLHPDWEFAGMQQPRGARGMASLASK